MDQLETPSFAGHESFPLRYAWLPKAVAHCRRRPGAFSDEEAAMVDLGVGKNMVRAIRHWGLACGVLEPVPIPNKRGAGVQPSQFGEAVLGERGIDPYLEDTGTLWLLHWKLTSNPAGPTTWYWAFNVLPELEFTKDQLLKGLADLVERKAWKRVATSTLNRDVDCFVRTYLPSRTSKRTTLEDCIDSPLVELCLLQGFDDGQSFAFERGHHATLPSEVVTYAVLEYWSMVAPHRNSLAFDHIAYYPQSPGRVFKLSENALMDHLENVETLTDRAIGFDTTAGLRQLLKRKDFDADQFFDRHWRKRKPRRSHAKG